MTRLTYPQLRKIADTFTDAGLIAEGEQFSSRVSDWEVWEEEGREEDERPTTGPRPTLKDAKALARLRGFTLHKTPAGYALHKAPNHR